MQPLETKKCIILEQQNYTTSGDKKSHNLWGKNKFQNLLGQKKIMQPLGTKKNQATSWGQK